MGYTLDERQFFVSKFLKSPYLQIKFTHVLFINKLNLRRFLCLKKFPRIVGMVMPE
jgi:hypothetical protein